MKRSTGIVFLLALALAAFVYFYDVKRKPATEASSESSKPAFSSVGDGRKDFSVLLRIKGIVTDNRPLGTLPCGANKHVSVAMRWCGQCFCIYEFD